MLAQAALRHPSPTLMRLRGPSRTSAHRPRVRMGCTPPARRSSPFRTSTDVPACRRSVRRPPWTSAPLQSSSPGARAIPPVARLVGRHFLSWASLPYDTVSSWRIRVSAADPSAARGHVRGLATSCAALTTSPPDAFASERPWALPFKEFPSPQSVPLSGPMPSCRYPSPGVAPKSSTWERSRLQGLVPATNPFSHRHQVVPAADPFLGFDPPECSPIRPGARFGRGASPLAL